MLKILKRYKPSNSKYKKIKTDRLINAQNFYDGREIIINAFKNKIFPLNEINPQYNSEEDVSPSSSDSEYISERDRSPDKTFNFTNKDLNELLFNMENELDPNTVKKYFYCYFLRDLQKLLDRTKKNKELHRDQMDLIKGALKTTKNDIKYMSEGAVKNKKLDLLTGLAKKTVSY